MSKSYRFVIEEENAGKRLDIFLERELNVLGEEVSRSFIHQFLNHALVNDSFRKKNYRLKIHDIITFTRPKLPPLKLIPEEIDFDVIFEDKHLIVVNKPAGLVVHPSRGHQSGTLINGLLNRLGGFKDNDSPLSEEDESHFRPGIVHRLDKDTSGLLVVARDPVTQRKLVSLFQNREVEKHYLALVKGKLPESGKIHEPIARDTR
ncbi:MAG: RluA family pseudouridine synthase, partial [Spirochaetota bacterium]|nr:RluA family pseudouridine synthase [Spirochaetota bacterium]